LLWLCASFAWAQEAYPLKVESVKEEGGATLWAHNNGPAPISLVLKLTVAENVASDVPLPIVAVVAAHSRERIGRLSVRDRRLGWRYATSWSYRRGAYTAKHSPDAMYRVPWMDGSTFRIGQAPGGVMTTHTTAASREAVDITMPEGTPIVAARGGTVIQVAADFTAGGEDPALRDKGNVVRVLHDDGTIGDYVHFRYQGVTVREDEVVAPGKLLGYAGNTGYSSGPHLHFAVTRVVLQGDALQLVSEPFSFYVGNPPRVFLPKTGLAVPAEYGARALAP
jgi:murein DD-endopeptidase MepM/ murein hydrolase activator NlpD